MLHAHRPPLVRLVPPLVTVATLVAACLWIGAATARAQTTTCILGGGPNPCCPWEGSGNCTWDDAVSDCNDPDAKTGAYSQACADYLESCTETSWMRDAVTAMRDFIAAENAIHPNGFLPVGVSIRDAERKAKRVVDVPWTAAFDTSDGKCMSVGFAQGTYLGIYNCLSPFEQSGHQTGCRIFGFLGSNKYAATVRNHPPAAGGLQFLCPPSTPISSRHQNCAFNLLDERANNSFRYVATTSQPYDVVTRGWFNTARTDPNTGSSPIYLAPYENYHTGHPVFGFTRGVFDGTTFRAAALVLQYIADSPYYEIFDQSCAP